MRIALWLTHIACIALGALIVVSFPSREDSDFPLVMNFSRAPVTGPSITGQPTLLPEPPVAPIPACTVQPPDVLDQLMTNVRGDLKICLRQAMAKNYPGVAEELNLNQAETNAFYDLAQKYQPTLTAHRQLNVWLRNIRAGMPALSEGQTRSLVDIIAAEQMPVTWEDSNTRILESARPYLGVEQYTALNEVMTRMANSDRARAALRRTPQEKSP